MPCAAHGCERRRRRRQVGGRRGRRRVRRTWAARHAGAVAQRACPWPRRRPYVRLALFRTAEVLGHAAQRRVRCVRQPSVSFFVPRGERAHGRSDAARQCAHVRRTAERRCADRPNAPQKRHVQDRERIGPNAGALRAGTPSLPIPATHNGAAGLHDDDRGCAVARVLRTNSDLRRTPPQTRLARSPHRRVTRLPKKKKKPHRANLSQPRFDGRDGPPHRGDRGPRWTARHKE